MVEVPDQLRCLFSTSLERRGDSYVLGVPREELDGGEVIINETYRVAVLPQAGSPSRTPKEGKSEQQRGTHENGERTPPVEEGEVHAVEIESVGDQGDGIAKVERGYVLIVPEVRPGDEPTVEIENVRENVAFAQVIDDPATASAGESESDARGGLASQPDPFDPDDAE